MASTKDAGEKTESLTNTQKARIERNRQRALLLRQARLTACPYSKTEKPVVHVAGTKLIDSGGGFFLEENNEEDEKKVVTCVSAELDDPLLFPFEEDGRPTCQECSKPFGNSYLLANFDERVCDDCRHVAEKYTLIPKTEAKDTFLLKDCDLEKREPILRYILKKNPHSTYGQMHLYLRSQVEARALEVWESLEKLEEAKASRNEKKDKLRKKRFNNKVKELRKSVRSSLWQKKTAAHEHEYGPEKFDAEEDNYYKTCTTCGHVLSYEKM